AGDREWLVTNGIGGFASGTVAGPRSPRDHRPLFPALQPPLGRTQPPACKEGIIQLRGPNTPPANHPRASRAVEPHGFLNVERFQLEGTIPVWSYAIADALLEKRIWMRQGENTTYVQYTLVRANNTLEIESKALVNYRDYHATTHAGNWRMKIEPV